MLVRNWMSKNPITIDVNDTMEQAIELMHKHHIRALPVMDRGNLIGIITDRDLKRASPSDTIRLEKPSFSYIHSKVKVGKIMTWNPITVPMDYTIEETAEILMKNKISSAPVLDDKGDLVGIITQQDIFEVLVSLTGIGNRGVQFAFLVEDRPGSIKEVTDILRSYGCRLLSILTTYQNVSSGYRKVYIRVFNVDRRKLPTLKAELVEKARILYIVDHRENRREIIAPFEVGQEPSHGKQ